MTREELIAMHEETCAKARNVMRSKNVDYAGGSEDPFVNFRASVVFNVKPEIGILIRTVDKFKRIQSFVETGTLHVKNEPVDDAIEDSINYLILLKGMIVDRRKAMVKK